MDYEIIEQIFDTLARNTDYDQFDPDEFENMSVLKDPRTKQGIIAMTKGDKEYILRLDINDKGEWEIFDEEN